MGRLNLYKSPHYPNHWTFVGFISAGGRRRIASQCMNASSSFYLNHLWHSCVSGVPEGCQNFKGHGTGGIFRLCSVKFRKVPFAIFQDLKLAMACAFSLEKRCSLFRKLSSCWSEIMMCCLACTPSPLQPDCWIRLEENYWTTRASS